MSDIVLYGATGYTGTRVARCLARRGASFSVAGRNRDALEAVGRETGAVAAHVVESGDAGALARACGGAAVLVSCVGPFVEHGGTAVEAALQAGVHYVDSTGEASFVRRLIVDHGAPAATAGIAMVPAMGFDEVPADVAASLAAGDMGGAELRLTYALPSGASSGTIMSALGILGARAIFLRAGREVEVPTGGQRRWAPMPPPLGLRRALSLGFAETHLAPLHLDLVILETYVTTGLVASTALAIGRPALPLVSKRPVASVAASLGTRIQGAPSREGRWTVLAEARSGTRWRNVALSGRDVYGLTAELLAWGSMSLVGSSPRRHGVLSPVAAFGTEPLTHELKRNDVAFAFYEPSHAT